ncbi:MAG: anti-sigma factor [Burkholderiaceae bacterium]
MTMDDSLLHAWLDGELGPERHAEVEVWLRANPEDAARVRLWAADRDVLRARLNPVLEEPVPDALTRTVWRGRTPLRWRTAAAALALFAVGGIVGAALMAHLPTGVTTLLASAQTGAGAGTSPGPGASAPAAMAPWLRRAALAHAVYVPELRHPVEVAVAAAPPDEQRAQEEHLSRWLTKRLTVPVKAFDLRAQGFELVGGRLLPDATGPSAQLMYQALPPASNAAAAATAPSASSAAMAAPARVTVYLRKPDAATPAAFRYERQGELGLFYWVEGDSAHGGATGYALVGTLPRERLLALAEAIYQQGQPAR